MSTFASASRVRLARVAPFDARAAGGGARASTPTSPVAAVGNRLSQRVALAGSALLAPKTRATPLNPRRSRRAPLRTLALVNVDLGPAAVLGASVMTSAIALYQVRASRPEVSRDQDVFFSSVGLLCGGILVFQGWRLDPLMLFGQLLTAGTAVAFASEAIGLRQEILDRELEAASPQHLAVQACKFHRLCRLRISPTISGPGDSRCSIRLIEKTSPRRVKGWVGGSSIRYRASSIGGPVLKYVDT